MRNREQSVRPRLWPVVMGAAMSIDDRPEARSYERSRAHEQTGSNPYV